MSNRTPADVAAHLRAVQQAQPEHRFSRFNPPITNRHPAKTMELAELWDEITSERHRAQTERIRAATDKDVRKALKAQLPYVTPAGIFNYPRRDTDLVTSSGMLVLDFDHVPSVPVASAVLLADEEVGPHVMLAFKSPSGDGVKAIMRTDPDLDHRANFRLYADYLNATYACMGLIVDKSGINESRPCYIPYDPTAYLHPSYTSAWITQ